MGKKREFVQMLWDIQKSLNIEDGKKILTDDGDVYTIQDDIGDEDDMGNPKHTFFLKGDKRNWIVDLTLLSGDNDDEYLDFDDEGNHRTLEDRLELKQDEDEAMMGRLIQAKLEEGDGDVGES